VCLPRACVYVCVCFAASEKRESWETPRETMFCPAIYLRATFHTCMQPLYYLESHRWRCVRRNQIASRANTHTHIRKLKRERESVSEWSQQLCFDKAAHVWQNAFRFAAAAARGEQHFHLFAQVICREGSEVGLIDAQFPARNWVNSLREGKVLVSNIACFYFSIHLKIFKIKRVFLLLIKGSQMFEIF